MRFATCPNAPALVALSLAGLPAAVSQQTESAPPHWSFVAPERVEPPAVVEDGWIRGPLDRFVLARLEREGLAPSEEASRATLLRRLSLDLTGLPPTVEDVEAFEADARPDAYERAVDRLLASPHFGEREALAWLDLARYADTSGYLNDPGRQMWKWRDWLVDAFNENRPFDQLTVEMLAGDLLPGATLGQRIATGFNRNHPVAGEGGGQPGEYAHRYVSDRVRTTSTVWLGLTLACAECHDHKFDPISQREYYGFYAFFDNVPETGLMPGEANPRPFLRLPDEGQAARLLELQSELAEQDRLAMAGAAAAATARAAWEESVLADLGSAASGPLPTLTVALAQDEPAATLRGIGHSSWVDGVRGRALRLEGDDTFVDCGDVAKFSAGDAFTLSAWVRVEGGPIDRGGSIVAKVAESAMFRGYALGVDGNRVYFDLRSHSRPKDAITVVGRDPITQDRWHQITATYDGSRTQGGMRIYVDGVSATIEEEEEEADGDEAVESTDDPVDGQPEEGRKSPGVLKGEIDNAEPLRIGCTDGDPFHGAIDEVRVFDRALTSDEVRAMVEDDLRALLRQEAPRTPEEEFLLRDYYRDHVSPELAPIAARRAELRAALRKQMDDVPLVSVMAERDERKPTHILIRGDYTRPGSVVAPGVPAVLPALVAGAPKDRLALAHWLTRDDHPLVGRVTVNRVWARFFGTGLVETLDDFGTRGAAPSHPGLLDWLAREFVDGGWDHKSLVRTIVCSATYRQESRMRPELLERDPANRLLARARRLPLEAEIVRDNALAIAGLLDSRLHGPGVRPWQPDGLWAAAAATTDEDYEPSPVADRYRRGLYVHWKRAVPYASFTVFDAPTREVCTVTRTRTNTPLQALVLLNDRVYVEAARALAQGLLAHETGDGERLVRGFRACVARAPSAVELSHLVELLNAQRARFHADPDAAAAYTAVGDLPAPDHIPAVELAAWTGVGSVLLNLDETITRN